MTRNGAYGALAIAGMVFACACQSTAALRPAVLESADAQSIARLKSALAGAMGVASIELGAGDPARNSTIAVLPPPAGPLEGRSTARPALFDLKMRGTACVAVSEATGEEFALPGVSCRAIGA